jgi:hypothetical protein
MGNDFEERKSNIFSIRKVMEQKNTLLVDSTTCLHRLCLSELQIQEYQTAKNSKLRKLPESCFEPAGKGGWPPKSTWINGAYMLT